MSFICPKGHQSDDNDYCSVCGTRMEAQSIAQTGAGGMDLSGGGLSGFGGQAASAPADACPDCGTARTPGARFCEVCRYDFVNKKSNTPDAGLQTPVSAPAAAFAQFPAPAQSLSGFDLPPSTPISRSTAPAQSLSGFDLPPSTPISRSTASAPVAPVAVSTASQGGTGAGTRWKLTATADKSLMTEADPARPFPENEPAREFTLDLRENIVGRKPASASASRPDAPIPDPGVSGRHLRFESRDDGSLWVSDVGSSNGTLFRGKSLDAGVAVQLADGDELTLGMWTRLRVSKA